ncbi:OmpA family protein [Parvibaculaceae bacterium PLY_AMNH_Bact1]|nr:OmpA family protein [Parvibaculaceae bacterium PLY_AMNH_Bact1]
MTSERQPSEACSSATPGIVERATKRFGNVLGTVLLVTGLAACSTAPDWARPGLIYGDDAEAAAADPNTEKDFPELADVPGEVPARSSATEVQEAVDGLAADRERARYSDEILRGGTGAPAPAPRSAAPTSSPAPLPTATLTAPSPAAAAASSNVGVIPEPARGGRSSLASAESAAEQVVERATQAAVTAPVVTEPVSVPAPQASAPVAAAPEPVAAATPVAPAPAQPAQTNRRPAVPAVPDTARVTSTPQANVASSATPNYRERPPVPVQTTEPAAQAAVVPTPRATPSVAAAATTVPRSSSTFEASSAPALTQEALEAAGPIVSSRYGAAGAPTGSADPEDPVEVNLDALRGLGPVGPGASLAPAQSAPNGTAYANQGGPGNIPPYVVSFAHGSTGLNAEDRQKIAAAAASAAAYNGIVRVVGHASSRTGDLGVGDHLLANFNVSMKRANAVANELIRAGLDPSRVVVEAKGDAVPVYYESMPAGEAGNRRAEIFIE